MRGLCSFVHFCIHFSLYLWHAQMKTVLMCCSKIPPSVDSLCVLVPRVNGVGGGGHREMGLEG